jgi:hypothetical protein
MKFACLAAAAAAAMIAMPAVAAIPRVSHTPSAAVHISAVSKTDAQMARAIKAAAVTICGDENDACARVAVREARRQYATIRDSRDGAVAKAEVEMIREDSASMRVRFAGRSPAQIEADIDVAAKTVCEAVGAGDSRGCVGKAARSAKAQVRQMAVAPGARQLAAR